MDKSPLMTHLSDADGRDMRPSRPFFCTLPRRLDLLSIAVAIMSLIQAAKFNGHCLRTGRQL
ncbi:MAG: hypothetical protein ACOVO0_09125 [Burkholderiaceae bacterium]